jgi:hypothetical protein
VPKNPDASGTFRFQGIQARLFIQYNRFGPDAKPIYTLWSVFTAEAYTQRK